jgi:Protein of unknown function (DUF3617)
MVRIPSWMIVAGCSLAVAVSVGAQIKQKPGLWEVTATMSMAGMPPMPANAGSPFAPRTTQVCVTQAMIDKYGGPNPQPQHGDCKMTDVVMKPNGMTGRISCTGQMNVTGTVESTWTDAGTTTHTNLHMTGDMQMGQMKHPVDMTMKADSTFKGPDCGSIKPIEMPAEK